VDSTIDQLWRRIEAGLQLPTGLPLAPGASAAAITNLERLLGIHLPSDIRDSQSRHDGGFPMQLPHLVTILSVEEIGNWWQVLEELLHDEEWARQPPLNFTEEALRSSPHPGPIQPVWWHQCWIPIAFDLGGNLSCVDLVPAPGGIVGQIIDWDHECGPTRVLFASFAHLLAALADDIESHLDW
jgi:cell wall assembly regulator SMI1